MEYSENATKQTRIQAGSCRNRSGRSLREKPILI
jgi:hypothetical protein